MAAESKHDASHKSTVDVDRVMSLVKKIQKGQVQCPKDLGCDEISAWLMERQAEEPLLGSMGDEEFREDHPAFVEMSEIFASLYMVQRSNFWTEIEVEKEFGEDRKDFLSQSPEFRTAVVRYLAWFQNADALVADNLGTFEKEVCLFNLKRLLRFQAMMEDIHAKTYALLTKLVVVEQDEIEKMWRSMQDMEGVKLKADWAKKWTDPSIRSFAERVLGFLCVESIMFSSAFCFFTWLKKRGIMKKTTFSNAKIMADEIEHCRTGAILSMVLMFPVPERQVRLIMEEAVNAEIMFICGTPDRSLDSIDEEEFSALTLKNTGTLSDLSLPGMNKTLMCKYVRHVANTWLVNMGFAPLYDDKNPFTWMTSMKLDVKTNFFEGAVQEYNDVGMAPTVVNALLKGETETLKRATSYSAGDDDF
jgi:ribonucleoside-diphosphate reductase subunit M2